MHRKQTATRALLALLLLPAASKLMAQAAPTPPTAGLADQAETPDDVVVLSPFSVTTENEGFQAVDTLGGARVKTKLVDTPSALSVITKHLLETSGITNAEQLLVYTTNTEVSGLNGNFSGVSARGFGVSGNPEATRLVSPTSVNRARGLTAMDNTRNYFSSEIPWDSFNIERVDISRGPNSFLFGLGSPSGISNYSTNRAIFKDQGSVEARYGSYGSVRQSLDLNKVILPGELAIRVDLLNDDTQYRQKPAYSHSKRAYGTVRYDPKFLSFESAHSSIEVTAEYGQVRSNNPRVLPPMDFLSGYFRDGTNKGGYDPFDYAGDALGGVGSFVGTHPTMSPWVNSQDYHYIWPGPNAAFWYDASTGSQLNAMTTVNNPKDAGGANGLTVLPQTLALYTSGFSNYAKSMNYLDSKMYPGAYAGTVQYGDKSLTDPSVYNFYNNLIDGPNKAEWQNWKTISAKLDQSFFNGKLSVQAIVDHQDYDNGQQGLLNGYSVPYISVDLDSYLIMYPSALGSMAVKNPNVGRAFIAADTGAGNSSAHYVRDNVQGMANAEFRAEDFVRDTKLAKLLGNHSVTALWGSYTTEREDRAWDQYATDVAFANVMGDPKGSITGYRGISWVAYLGPSMTDLTSPTGLNLSNMANQIVPKSTTIQHYDNTWTGAGLASGETQGSEWYNPYTLATETQLQNPANYVGWTNIPVNILNATDNIDDLYTSGTKSKLAVRSAAFMYQGKLFDDMFIPEFGWRRDKVRQTATNAPYDLNTHVASMNYTNTGANEYGNDEATMSSTSFGAAFHLPKSLRGKLPFNSDVSLYYFHGSNTAAKIRYGFDAQRLPDEKGKSDDIGVQIDSLGGKVSFRVTYFKTKDKNAAASTGASDPLGANGYYLYLLPAWGSFNAAANGYYYATGDDLWGYCNDGTGGALDTQRKASVEAWQNQIGTTFGADFFKAYGLGLNSPGDMVTPIQNGNWSYFESPNNYVYPWNIANTGNGKINGTFPVISQDVESKGFEVEGTVHPIPNLDLTFNFSKVSAVQTALGQSTVDFIKKQYDFFTGPAGFLPLWGYWGSYDATGNSTMQQVFMQNIWAAYLAQTAQLGTPQPELRKWNAKFIANYTFNRGFLKGVNIGGGYRWADRPIIGYGIHQVTDSYGNNVWINDPSQRFYGDYDQHVDAWIGYQTKLTKNLTWRIQLNLQNVGETPHLTPISVEPDGSPAAQRIVEGTTYWLTSTFKF